MRSMKRILFVLFLVLIHSSGFTQTFEFSNYSSSQGLVHKSVYSICQDADGFLWIGTANGLSRFDSYDFKNFTHSSEKQSALHGTTVYKVIEGSGQRMWLSTDAGLEYIDKVKESFHLVELPGIKGNVFRDNVNLDSKGNVWMFNTSVGILGYDSQKDSIFLKVKDFSSWPVDKGFFIYQFYVIDDVIWIVSNQGVAEYNYKTKHFEFFEKSKHYHCHKVRLTQSGKLILSFMLEGVYVIDLKKRRGSWIRKDYIEKKIDNKTTIIDAIMENDSTIWVSVVPGVVRICGDTYEYYNYNSKEHYFQGNAVSRFFLDRNENLWLGTYENGLFLRKGNDNTFSYSTRLYKDNVDKTLVTNLHVFKNGSLIFGDSKGIYFCDDYKNLIPGCAKRIFKTSNPFLFPVNESTVFVSDVDTFYIYNSENNTFKRSHEVVGPSCAVLGNDSILWNGSWHGILYGYNLRTQQKYFLESKNFGNNNGSIYAIVSDSDGSLWMSVMGSGLVHIIHPKQKKPIIERYNAEGEGEFHLNVKNINCLHFDKYGNLWIGTNGDGLICRNKQSGRFQVFNASSGLKSNSIEAINSDFDGNIWFTSSVLTKYDVIKKTFVHFSYADGIKGDFVAKATSQSPSGEILFANSGGIYLFNPYKVSVSRTAEKPLLTGLRIRGIPVKAGENVDEEIAFKESITYSDLLPLAYKFNSFAIEFAGISFQESQILEYEYMLEGVDQDWIPSHSRNRLASYVDVDPGTYVFKVRSSYDTGDWSKPTVLQLKIVPPWWMTTWFKLTLAFIIIFIITAIVRYRFQSIKEHNVLLEEKVKQRTTKLENANLLLKEKQVVLEMKNEELGLVLSAKDRLLRVIAHDFKNPLNTLIGFATVLRDRIGKLKAEEIKEYIESIMVSSLNLREQMNNVLDWALAENQEITYSPIEINIETIIEDSVELVKEGARQKDISITTQFDYIHNALIDPRMISTVLRNLLINAIKFTPKNGSVAIIVQEYDDEIEVSVVDSGNGISNEALQAIFESDTAYSETDTNARKSTGIGLRLSKIFIEKHNGRLLAKSLKERGSIFSFNVPKAESKANKSHKLSKLAFKHKINKPSIDIKEDKDVTILIVDDDANMLKLLKSEFELYFTVLTAHDGNSGIQLASTIVPSLVISDVSMPQLSGIDLCGTLKNDEATSYIPIILITADEKFMAEGYASGADDYMLKPFDVKELVLKAYSLLENRKRIISKSENKDTLFILPESYSDKVIKKILTYINEHYCEQEMDIAHVGDKVGLSRTQLWRKFKSATEQNLSDYIRNLRLEKARTMLLTGKYKVAEVAYDVGFTNPQYFSKAFSRHFGYSPKDCVDERPGD